MNKQHGREMKALNIRDFKNDPDFRQKMGLFKHVHYAKAQEKAKKGILYTQADFFKDIMKQAYKTKFIKPSEIRKVKND